MAGEGREYKSAERIAAIAFRNEAGHRRSATGKAAGSADEPGPADIPAHYSAY
jgi:hypothetical protein